MIIVFKDMEDGEEYIGSYTEKEYTNEILPSIERGEITLISKGGFTFPVYSEDTEQEESSCPAVPEKIEQEEKVYEEPKKALFFEDEDEIPDELVDSINMDLLCKYIPTKEKTRYILHKITKQTPVRGAYVAHVKSGSSCLEDWFVTRNFTTLAKGVIRVLSNSEGEYFGNLAIFYDTGMTMDGLKSTLKKIDTGLYETSIYFVTADQESILLTDLSYSLNKKLMEYPSRAYEVAEHYYTISYLLDTLKARHRHYGDAFNEEREKREAISEVASYCDYLLCKDKSLYPYFMNLSRGDSVKD